MLKAGVLCLCVLLAAKPAYHPTVTPLPAFPLHTHQEWELLSEVPLLQQAREEQQQEPVLAPGSVALSWRGDGRFFATATLDAPGGRACGVAAAAACFMPTACCVLCPPLVATPQMPKGECPPN